MPATLPGTTPSLNRSRFRALAALLLAISALVGSVGVGRSAPLERHEILVARTAEEMLARDSWLVPYFADVPRLRKPPLSYWAVMGIDALGASDGVVTEMEARMPSVVAGVAMTGLTIALGTILVTPAVGLIAGLLLVSCSGFVSYTHCARPEMLYAALCTAGLVGFALASRAHERLARGGLGPEPSTGAAAARLGWLAFGAAALAKGPHLPLIIVAGWLVGGLLRGQGRRTLASLRPVSGLAVFVLVGTTWFVAIWLTVPEATSIWREETLDRYAGSFGSSWLGLLDPYYLYRTAGLVLPWLLLYPLALAEPWGSERQRRPEAIRLWGVVIVTAVILSFSHGRRWYYMLPVLSALAVLMAGALDDMMRRVQCSSRRQRFWGAALAAHVLVVVVAALLLIERRDARIDVATLLPSMLIGGITVLSLAMLYTVARSRRGPVQTLVAATAGIVLVVLVTQSNGAWWRPRRMESMRFAADVNDLIGPEERVLGWQDDWASAQYYLHRVIPCFVTDDSLAARVAADRTAWLLVDAADRAPDLGGAFRVEIQLRADFEGVPDRLELWRIEHGPQAVALH